MGSMSKTDILHSGKIYNPNDDGIMQEQKERLRMLKDYNDTDPADFELREKKLRAMFEYFGKNAYIEIPFRANWAGKFVYFGDDSYANFNLTLVDDTHIFIGEHTMLGPCVTIATATHPLSTVLRQKGAQYNKPVHIGNNCFIGSGVTILPGVSIGDDTVIEAGSVVTKDIPSSSLAYGNPCRVVRTLDRTDDMYYDDGKLVDSLWFQNGAE